MNIHNVKLDPKSAPSSSIIEAWVSYPVEAMIDLRNLQFLLSDINGIDYTTPGDKLSETDKDVQRASIIHFEYHTLAWILLLFVIITLMFLLCICCVWCLCCRRG